MRLIALLLIFGLLVSCGTSASTTSAASTPETEEVTTEEVTMEENGKVFGEKEDFSQPIDYGMMVDKLSATPQDTMTLTVKGKVNEVCQAKGCWMTIDGEDEVMVKFKDYGFFMPMDISGREVVMHGKAYYQTTAVDELRHYAEDAGKSADEIALITEPKLELRFLASGVLLLN